MKTIFGSEVGPYILKEIKKSKHTVLEVAENTLNLHTSNFSRRLKENNINLEEIGVISKYLGMPIKVQVGEIDTELNPKGKESIYAISTLQQKIIDLMEERERLREEIRNLKQEEES